MITQMISLTTDSLLNKVANDWNLWNGLSTNFSQIKMVTKHTVYSFPSLFLTLNFTLCDVICYPPFWLNERVCIFKSLPYYILFACKCDHKCILVVMHSRLSVPWVSFYQNLLYANPIFGFHRPHHTRLWYDYGTVAFFRSKIEFRNSVCVKTLERRKCGNKILSHCLNQSVLKNEVKSRIKTQLFSYSSYRVDCHRHLWEFKFGILESDFSCRALQPHSHADVNVVNVISVVKSSLKWDRGGKQLYLELKFFRR